MKAHHRGQRGQHRQGRKSRSGSRSRSRSRSHKHSHSHKRKRSYSRSRSRSNPYKNPRRSRHSGSRSRDRHSRKERSRSRSPMSSRRRHDGNRLRHGLDSTARERDLDADDSLDDGFLAEVVSVDDVDADHMLSVLDDVCQDAELTPKKQGIHPYSSRKGKQPLIGKARFKFTPRREMDLVPQQIPREEFESVLEELISENELVTIPVAHLKGELRKVHPVMVIELLEDKWNKETLEALEQMSDVVKCPECSLALVVDVEVKRFKCAQCSNSFCRHCMKKWQCNEHDLCISVKPWTSSYSGKIVNIPAFWEDPIPNQVYSLVDLSTTSMEFVDIVQHVQKFMKCDVKKIFRIQNHKIWEKYSVTRSHMIEELGMQLTKESRLFHGTDVNAIEAICNEGFDLRVSGKNAVAFGNGIYFARSASYSHRYAKMGQQAGVISLNPPISSGQSGNLTTYINTIQFGHLMTTTQGSVPTPQGFSTANQQVVQPIQIAPPTNQRASTSNTATPYDPFRSSTFGNGSTQAGSKNMSDLLAASAAAKALVLSKLNIQLKQFRQQAEGAHKMPASPSIGTASISSQKSVPSQHMPSHSLQPPANPGTSSVTGNISTAVVSNSESVVQNSGPSGSLIKGSASQSGMPSADGLLNWNIGGSVSNDTKVRLDAVNRLRQNEQHVLKTLILRFGIAKNENELKEALVNFRKPSSYKIPLKYGAVEKKADGTFTLTIKPGFKLTDARPCDCHRIPTQICDHLFNQPSVLTDALKRDQVLSSEKRLQFAKYFAMVLFFVMDSFPQSKVTTSSVNSIPSVTHASMVTCATGDSKTKVSWTSSITGNMSKNSASLISEQALAGSHLLGNNFSNPSQGLDVKPSGSSMQSNSTGMPNDTLTRLFTSGAKAVISATSHSQHSARKRTNLLGVSVCKCHRLPLTTCRKNKNG